MYVFFLVCVDGVVAPCRDFVHVVDSGLVGALLVALGGLGGNVRASQDLKSAYGK